jgi:hypothetical protein
MHNEVIPPYLLLALFGSPLPEVVLLPMLRTCDTSLPIEITNITQYVLRGESSQLTGQFSGS